MKRMTIEALSETPEFKSLSAKKKFWVQTYLESGSDPVLATKSSFDTEGENARTFSYQVLRNKKIQAALRLFQNFGKSKRGIFLDDIKAEIAASKPGSLARSRLRALYAQMVFGMYGSTKLKRGASR